MGFTDLLANTDRVVRAALGDATIVYTPTVGDPVTVSGIFDATYQHVDAGQVGASGSGPAVFLRLSDLPSDPCDDLAATVTIAGTGYTIFEAKPDGQGAVLIRLHEA